MVLTYSFSQFDHKFLSIDVLFETGVWSSSSIILICERNGQIQLQWEK